MRASSGAQTAISVGEKKFLTAQIIQRARNKYI